MADEIKKDELAPDENNTVTDSEEQKESQTTDESLSDAKEKIDRARAEADAHKVIRTREAKERAKDEERQEAERERKKAEQEKQARDVTEARIAAMEYAETYRQRLREQKAGVVSQAKQRELQRMEEEKARAKADEQRAIQESIEREREAARERRERAESLLKKLDDGLSAIPVVEENGCDDEPAATAPVTEAYESAQAENTYVGTSAVPDTDTNEQDSGTDCDEPIDGTISIDGAEVAHILSFDVASIEIPGLAVKPREVEATGVAVVAEQTKEELPASSDGAQQTTDAADSDAEAQNCSDESDSDTEAPAEEIEAADDAETLPDKKALKKQKKDEKARIAAEKKAEKKRRSVEADYVLIAKMSEIDEKNATAPKNEEPKGSDEYVGAGVGVGIATGIAVGKQSQAGSAELPVYPVLPKIEDTPKATLYPTREPVLSAAERAKIEREEMTALLRKEGASGDKKQKPVKGKKGEDFDLSLTDRLSVTDSSKAKDRELERFAASELDSSGKGRKDAEQRVIEKQMEKEMSRLASSGVDSGKKTSSKKDKKAEKPATTVTFDKKEIAKIVAIHKKTSILSVDSRYEYEITKMEQELEKIVGTYALKNGKTKKRMRYLEANIKKLKAERKKAVKAIRADDERYYYTVIRDMRSEKLARRADRYQVLKLREELIGLLNRRDALNLRLSEYYLGKEKNEKHGSDADTRKAYDKGARKERKRYRSLVKKIDAQRILLSQKQKVKKLVDEQIDFGGSISELTYVLKKRKPKGDLKRECTKALKETRKKYKDNKKRIERESVRAFKDGKKAKGKRNAMIIGWISIVVIAALAVAFFIFKDEILGFISTLIPELVG